MKLKKTQLKLVTLQNNFKDIIILLVLSIILLVAIAFVTKFISNAIAAIIGFILCIVEVLSLSFALFLIFKDMAQSMMKDYENNKHLLSGIICVLLIAITSYLLFGKFGSIIYENSENELSNIANTIISLTPALLSLLGVHYSNMIQEANRKKDFLLANKPYPLIDCLVERIHPENTNMYIQVKIKNLSNNILIPLSLNGKELNYSPVTKDIEGFFKNICIPIDIHNEVSFLYKDSLENIYKTKLNIQIDVESQNRYNTVKYNEPILLSDEKLRIINNNYDYTNT